MKRVMASVIALLSCAWSFGQAAGADAIDPAVVGTWKLEFPGSAIYWAVREDGVYRLHGPGANPKQAGKITAAAGQWSIQAPVWADAGTYKFDGAVTWLVTGRFGTGTWKRVWSPANSVAGPPAGVGKCALLSLDEAARGVRAPVTAGSDPRVPDGCVFKSQLSDFDRITITQIPARRQAWMLTRSRPSPLRLDIPGVAEDAYAEPQGEHMVAHVLKGATQVAIRLTLVPPAEPGALDLPALAALAQAVDRRLGGANSSIIPDPFH